MPLPVIHGLDIHPKYQPVPNWDVVPMFDLMSVKVSEGATAQTPGGKEYFLEFRRREHRYRGMYHWVRPDSTAVAQYDNFSRAIEALGGLQVGDFLQSDWERTLDAKGNPLPMPTLALVMEFHARLQKAYPGRLMAYLSDWVEHFHAWLAEQPPEPLWYANYNLDPTNYNGGLQESKRYGATIWQCTSSLNVAGIIGPGGIPKRTDGNHILDRAALDRVSGYPVGDPRPPAPVEPPVVVQHQEIDMAYIITAPGRNPARIEAGYAFGVSADTLERTALVQEPVEAAEWDEIVANSDRMKARDAALANPPAAHELVAATVNPLKLTGTIELHG